MVLAMELEMEIVQLMVLLMVQPPLFLYSQILTILYHKTALSDLTIIQSVAMMDQIKVATTLLILIIYFLAILPPFVQALAMLQEDVTMISLVSNNKYTNSLLTMASLTHSISSTLTRTMHHNSTMHATVLDLVLPKAFNRIILKFSDRISEMLQLMELECR